MFWHLGIHPHFSKDFRHMARCWAQDVAIVGLSVSSTPFTSYVLQQTQLVAQSTHTKHGQLSVGDFSSRRNKRREYQPTQVENQPTNTWIVPNPTLCMLVQLLEVNDTGLRSNQHAQYTKYVRWQGILVLPASMNFHKKWLHIGSLHVFGVGEEINEHFPYQATNPPSALVNIPELRESVALSSQSICPFEVSGVSWSNVR